MRKGGKVFALFLSAFMAVGSLTVSVYADCLKKEDGITYRYSDSGENLGEYTGWAKSAKGKRYYYKNGVKVTKNTVIHGIRYKFDQNGVCTGKYTGFVTSSKEKQFYQDGVLFVTSSKVKRFYQDGVLVKDKKVTAKNGTVYYADSFGNLTGEDGPNPGMPALVTMDLMYGGEKYCLFIDVAPFIYGEDGKCYLLGDGYKTVQEPGYRIKENPHSDEALTALLRDGEPVGTLTYTDGALNADFEITLKEFDGADLYENGNPKEDYGLTLVSAEPLCYVDGTAVYLTADATKYDPKTDTH